MPIVSALAAVAARGYGFLQGRPSDFELIETQTVGAGGAANVTFNSIPGTYKHLQIRGIVRTAEANPSSNLAIRLNGDTGSNYAYHYLVGDGSTAYSGAASGAGTTRGLLAQVTGNTATSGIFGAIVTDILDYANSSKTTTVRTLGGHDRNGAGQILLTSDLWTSTNAVTSVTLIEFGTTNNLAQYSTFSLYGVK